LNRTYRVVVAGLGKRGRHHAAAFRNSPRFELAGISTRDPARLAAAAAELGSPRASTDLGALLREVKPDVFCFCTPPTVRLELIRLGIASGAALIAYEKPMAMSMREAAAIRQAVGEAGVKTVVSHQQRYGQHYRAVADVIRSGALGRVHTVYGHSVGWMLHLVTHLVDYMRWYNGEADAEWVMGQAAGRGKLADAHPSPDTIAGVIHFANGVRGYVESGAGAPDVPEVDYWWRKNRIGVQGTEGFAEVLTGAGWRAVTRSGGFQSGEGIMSYDLDMPPYVDDIARWLDDDGAVHPCHGESAYKGFEIVMGIVRSVVGRGQVALPLDPGEDEMTALARVLPEREVLLSFEGSRKEYPDAFRRA
jgi:predicted dehydrogenase